MVDNGGFLVRVLWFGVVVCLGTLSPVRAVLVVCWAYIRVFRAECVFEWVWILENGVENYVDNRCMSVWICVSLSGKIGCFAQKKSFTVFIHMWMLKQKST
jgi:hypothetical protein